MCSGPLYQPKPKRVVDEKCDYFIVAFLKIQITEFDDE